MIQNYNSPIWTNLQIFSHLNNSQNKVLCDWKEEDIVHLKWVALCNKTDVISSDVCAENFSHSVRLFRYTIPSVLYACLVPLGSPYIESWYVRLSENAHVGGYA